MDYSPERLAALEKHLTKLKARINQMYDCGVIDLDLRYNIGQEIGATIVEIKQINNPLREVAA